VRLYLLYDSLDSSDDRASWPHLFDITFDSDGDRTTRSHILNQPTQALCC